MSYINAEKDAIYAKPIHITAEQDGVQVDVAMQHTTGYTENIFSFVNNIPTPDGGTHEIGFKSACTKVFNAYAQKNNLIKDKDFRLFFYFKMSSRLYDMYRRRLSYDLFTPRQRFAAHLILDAEDNDCYMENVSKTCDELGISRRNLYNIISDFEALKIISYEQTGLVSIRDREQLRNIAQPALEFNENRD